MMVICRLAHIREDFVGYLDVSGDTTGENLSSKIEEYLTDNLGLTLNNMRGQCYDGAGTIRDKLPLFETDS